jgi:hypothetical protein
VGLAVGVAVGTHIGDIVGEAEVGSIVGVAIFTKEQLKTASSYTVGFNTLGTMMVLSTRLHGG